MTIERKHLLLVDDDPMSLGVLEECLSADYTLHSADGGRAGLDVAQQGRLPDMILLDVDMPDLDGYTVCQTLKRAERTAAIPIIFLTSHDSAADITHGFAVGAVDFIAKPVIPEVLRARVLTHLRLREARQLLETQNQHLETLVEERTHALLRVQELSIVALGALAETRDNETGNHIYRTQEYVRVMAETLTRLPQFHNQLGRDTVDMIWRSAPLHDIGKVGIPDDILLKPGKLTADEFTIMKSHARLGRDALRSAERRVHFDDSFLRTATQIAYSHHERWDGSGYPEGISGLAIPFSARLMAVADVYDALISRRVYKPAFPHAVALDLIREGRGTQFDPSVTDCFLDMEQTMAEISARFHDNA